MNRPIAMKVCAFATDTDDARTLLDMLGVYPEGREATAYSLTFHPKGNPKTRQPRFEDR